VDIQTFLYKFFETTKKIDIAEKIALRDSLIRNEKPKLIQLNYGAAVWLSW
jgi:hypothetical protein